jgi:DNA-binding NarL/FixJ family response regulator
MGKEVCAMRTNVHGKRSGSEITERRAKVLRLHQYGVDVGAIAERLGVTTATIRGDLKAAETWIDIN